MSYNNISHDSSKEAETKIKEIAAKLDVDIPALQEAVSAADTDDFIPTTALDTDVALTADSDAKVASQKATKAYVDAQVNSIDGLNDGKTFYGMGTGSVYLGSLSGDVATLDHNNTAVGAYALQHTDSTTETGYNTCIGYGAMSATATNSGFNTCIGALTGLDITGTKNTILGHAAGYAITTGSSNTCIGQNSSTIITGSNNVLLGTNADVTGAAATNQIAIGYGAVASGDNKAQFGVGITEVTFGTAGAAVLLANGSKLSGMATVAATVSTPTIIDGTQYLQLTVGNTTYNLAIVTPGT